eukprot:TRINITY_DN58443_c0_g1_i1.p1 TRINITY_DN58443_c0_g1~~TRINITY_DN58443_c0_g1_i1.p1  ORF type:complete len:100 (+),score=21.40 TRINITY_DN58443_c0_g1_i1:31-330(+)
MAAAVEEQSALAVCAGYAGSAVYNTGSFVGNTAVGTGCGLVGYDRDAETESWGKTMGWGVGYGARVLVVAVGTAVATGGSWLFEGACASRSGKEESKES